MTVRGVRVPPSTPAAGRSGKTWLCVELPVTDYREAWDLQTGLVAARNSGVLASDVLLLLEHAPVFTLGRRGGLENLTVSEEFLKEAGVPVVHVERGGNITYHGPGQLVGYPILDLHASGLTVSDYVERLEEIMIRTAAHWGVAAGRNPINRGVWVGNSKLGSIGVAIRHGISFHGFAFNVSLSLEPFGWINPCGLRGILHDVPRTGIVGETARGRSPGPDETRHRGGFSDGTGARGPRVADPFSDRTGRRRGVRSVMTLPGEKEPREHKPRWLRRKLPSGPVYEQVRSLIESVDLHTVCREARCPNQWECFSCKTATFLIMGPRCTRNCRFCAVEHGPLGSPDPEEPARVAEAAATLGLRYIVVTSVTRDDLADGGASFFAETIRAVRRKIPEALVEVLIPDFQGDAEALRTVLTARPDVLNHNLETVPRLYPTVRPGAVYERSPGTSREGRGLRSRGPRQIGADARPRRIRGRDPCDAS